MGTGKVGRVIGVWALGVLAVLSPSARAQTRFPFILPEQRTIEVRDPSELPPAPVADIPAPPTVSQWPTKLPPNKLSLDEAISIALANSQVVRVLAGVGAVSSGRTVYDVAIRNNSVDEAQSRFDPRLDVLNGFDRAERAGAVFDPLDPTRAVLTGLRTDDYRLDVGLSKPTVTGGTVDFGVNTHPARFRPGVFPLNPQGSTALELGVTQPLLQGGGMQANLAPIVLARIDTELSFFQFKDSLQATVFGVIEAYWNLVYARISVWARDQQVKQLEQAYARAEAQFRSRRVSRAVVAQSLVSLSNFRAALIAARANMLQREAALRNILGLPPMDDTELIPTTPPRLDRMDVAWDGLLALAGEQRPDIIELKLILEADQQQLLMARNQALPRVDAVGLYRWNGLEGEMPVGDRLATRPGQFTDWTLAVNFSVPLGLRRERAALRQWELMLARDRANLEQGMHQTAHLLATNLRTQAQLFEQYEMYQQTRDAARENLEQQLAEYRSNRVIFLNVLLAITDWGNAVSAEAESLLQYNTLLAGLERETGTILEAHGIRLSEERFGSLGPLGRWHEPPCYPSSLQPQPPTERYTTSDDPAEQAFDLEDPVGKRPQPKPQPKLQPEPQPQAEEVPIPEPTPLPRLILPARPAS